jgi:uncharacterized protein
LDEKPVTPTVALKLQVERPPAVAAKYDAWAEHVKEKQGLKYAEKLDSWGTIIYQQFESDKAAGRLDGWANTLTGLGTSRDKVTSTTFCDDGTLPFSVLEALYHNDDMAARIADAVPEQMFREGYELRLEDDPDGADELQDAANALGVDDAFEEASIWARKDGGAKVMMLINDGRDASEPVNEAAIKSIDGLRVLDRYMLFPDQWYDEPLKPKFGEPSVYRILTPLLSGPMGMASFTAGALVHETRLIHFRGARTSIRRRRANFGWDDSVFQRVYQVLLSFGVAWAGVTHLMSDASQAVMKIKGLLQAIAGNQKDMMLERAKLNDTTRSLARMLMIDAEHEGFERVPTPFQGIPELVDRFGQRLAGAADMPLTVLMGTSPGGLNATGESDLTNWYDKIASMQKRKLKPNLDRFYKLLMLSKGGPTSGQEKEVEICFKPLWKATEKEGAEIRKMQAETDQIEYTIGMATAEELATSRHGAHGWSPETTIDLDLRQQMMTADKKPVDGATPATPAGATGEDGAPTVADPNAEAKDPQTGLNGAQVTAMLAIVQAVADGQLPRESGVAMIVASFPVSPDKAEEIMGTVGKGFKPEKPEPEVMPGAAGGFGGTGKDGKPARSAPGKSGGPAKAA